MFQRIVVPLDGSERAERAIPVAARLARASGGSVVFVRVVLPPIDFGKYAAHHASAWERKLYESERAKAASYLAGAMLTHANDLVGIGTEMGVAGGIVPPTICSLAQSEHADLIVMCSRGETGFSRWLFGSVAQEVVRQSSVPVLVLNERGAAFPMSNRPNAMRALVALDGSPQSETVLEAAAELVAALAGPRQGLLHLLHVVDLPLTGGKWRGQAHVDAIMRAQARQEAETYLKGVADRLRTEPLRALKLAITSSVAVNPDVAGAIIRQAEHAGWAEQGEGCVLIALATHGRGGLQRLLMGSVTEQVLRSTRLPLLVVRPQEKAARSHVQAKKKRTHGIGGI
jgi:nucleotide-binding universal stress UspA family protein